jgi:hypothetical protein
LVIEYCFLSLNQQIILACWTALAAAKISRPIVADLDAAADHHESHGGGHGGHHGGSSHHGGGGHNGGGDWGRKRRSIEEIQAAAITVQESVVDDSAADLDVAAQHDEGYGFSGFGTLW